MKKIKSSNNEFWSLNNNTQIIWHNHIQIHCCKEIPHQIKLKRMIYNLVYYKSPKVIPV